jgi:hypothetical protein
VLQEAGVPLFSSWSPNVISLVSELNQVNLNGQSTRSLILAR